MSEQRNAFRRMLRLHRRLAELGHPGDVFAALDELERLRAERDAMRADAERYRYLTADLSGSARERRDVLLDRLAVMSYSAASADIDAALAEGAGEARPCTCHPTDDPPQPCAQKYALTECREAAAPKLSPLGEAVRIARGDHGPPTEPVRFAERAGEKQP